MSRVPISSLRLAMAAAIVALAALPAAAPAAKPTGRYQVVFERGATARSQTLLDRVLARAGVRLAGGGVPELGVATVRGGAAALRALRRDPAVASVSAEYTRDLRRAPNDPAWTQQDFDAPAGTPIAWYLAREQFPAAWDVTTGAGAIVGVIDTGITGDHPQLRGKIASADTIGGGSALTDPDGHGTHVSGLGCADTDDGQTLVGAGWDCRIAIVKIPFPADDQDIIDAIRLAVDRGADAINMSFGGGPPNAAYDAVFEYALARNVVLVAAASNDPDSDQGAPASQLQPGDAPNITAGRGLVVTAADFTDIRAGTGFGSQVSVAAYGFFDGNPPLTGPLGLLSAYPAQQTARETGLFPCGCRVAYSGDSRYAELEGTSMAVPQVTALAAMIGNLNPALTAREKMGLIKQTARGNGAWNGNLGFGIIDAGRAVDAARHIDRVRPDSRARAAKRTRLRRGARARVRISWRGADRAGHPGLVPSGVASFDLYLKQGRRWRRIRRATRSSTVVLRLRRGSYRVYTRARDRAGNIEAAPRRADRAFVVTARR